MRLTYGRSGGCVAAVVLLLATLLASAPSADAMPTYRKTVIGSDVASTPPGNCTVTTSHAYHLRECLDAVVHGDSHPNYLHPPFLGGIELADTHVIGTIRITYGNGLPVIPYKVKMWVGNDTSGHYTGKQYMCGWNTICSQHFYGADAWQQGFMWVRYLPPFYGCDTLDTEGFIQAIIWPNAHVRTIMMYKYMDLRLLGTVCGP